MDGLTLHALVLLPVGLGLLGFIEPCTIGGHLIFLGSQDGAERLAKAKALGAFVAVRVIVMGAFGAAVAALGGAVVSMQTSFWLIFGAVYVPIGLVALIGYAGGLKVPFRLSPAAWRGASNPVVLGFAFGLNIPACAAPILFGLMAMAATAGTAFSGFLMMALFGFALSAPLVLFLFAADASRRLEAIANALRGRRWIVGATFLVLGTWSIWFGLFVDPGDWSGR